MNLKLQKEIIHHILQKLGLFLAGGVQPGFVANLIDNNYLTNKKIGFENEDNKKYENPIWAATTKLEPAKVKVLIADTHEDIEEYTIIFQMDILPAYALRLSADDNDFGTLFVNVKDDKWIQASIAVQAKFLFGIEGLSEIPLTWERLDDFKDMYKLLIQFLNFYERE